jgi:zinc transport system substrate-binding protein
VNYYNQRIQEEEMIKQRIIVIIIFIGLLLNTIGCSPIETEESANNNEIIAYASVYPIYDFAKKIGGERINVKMATPPGAEPHGWEPSGKAIKEIEQSQVFLYNGLDLDPWAERIGRGLKDKVTIIAVGEEEALAPMIIKEGIGSYDPHIWLDPIIVIEMAKIIKDVFSEVDKENQNYYEENFNIFQSKLYELDKEYYAALSRVKNKNFIVSHGAFGYLAKRYGLNQITILGLTPQGEPSPAKLVELTTLIKKYNINTVFFEHLTSPKAANVLAKETGINVEVLHPIGGLTQEEMDNGEDYISIMRKNLTHLVRALD